MATEISGHVGVGDHAHDFTLPSLDGENISLSDYKGKRVILFMWASW
ncbi:MAG: redoxin domain-containing protein [SAR202 cluster bacterium]|nr:redoxin domain-containing protein [SAR202 cluster bacterium]